MHNYCKTQINKNELVTTGSDAHLVNPWSLVVCDNHIYVTSNGKDLLIRYDITGKHSSNICFYSETGTLLSNPSDPVVRPTGIVINPTTGYLISDGSFVRKSIFLIASESGDIFGYNKSVGGGNKAIRIFNASSGSFAPQCQNDLQPSPRPNYKGIAVIDHYVFAADFLNGSIDIFHDIGMTNSIKFNTHMRRYNINDDRCIAAPYNIVYLHCLLFVIYAYKNISTNADDNQTGGYIDIHDECGMYVKRFTSDCELKSPWGLIKTPRSFCTNESVIVGNRGSGEIIIYDKCGNRIGKLYDKSTKHPVVVDGLQGLYYFCNQVYFAAGSNSNGVVGSLMTDHCNQDEDECCNPCNQSKQNPCNPCNQKFKKWCC
jgi:uncharacterized protein (TIGR03118 family)